MGQEARVIQLQKDLIRLGFNDTLRALNWMLGVMNAENGYERHDGSHYYYHLVDGCQDLLNHGILDQPTLTGYILHDAEEDIPSVDNEIISDRFGGEVAMLVRGVTKRIGVDYKKKENTEDYLEAMLPFVKMCLIKIADRKHNFSTLESATPEKELRVALETENLFIPFAKEARQMYPEHSNYFHSFKTTIMPHLKKIKKYHADMAIKDARIEELEFKINLLTKEVK